MKQRTSRRIVIIASIIMVASMLGFTLLPLFR